VDVGVAEPGGRGPAPKLDDTGRRSDMAGHDRVRSDRYDPTVPDGDGRGPAPGRIDGRDATTGQDEIGGLVDGHPGNLEGEQAGRGWSEG
jgi:hypothetical protein